MIRSTLSDLISKQTRNAFREHLVGWTLRTIEDAFDAAGVACNRSFEPMVTGARRSCVEQHYASLDFRKPDDVRRLLMVYEHVIEQSEHQIEGAADRASAERALLSLKSCLSKEGLEYKAGKISAITQPGRRIFDSPKAANTISEVTRRAIFDHLMVKKIAWFGNLAEVEFLDRVFDLTKLPSNDGRLKTMRADIHQHRVSNLDWDDDWVYSDRRLDLLHGDDHALLRFLCEMVHPVVRSEHDAMTLVADFNTHLAADTWEITQGQPISGRATFVGRRCRNSAIVLPEPAHSTDVLSDEYVRELSTKCDTRLASGDLDGAVTVARTLLEAALGELEHALAGTRSDYGGQLAKQFKQVTKLLRMDEQRADLDERFKDVIRGLVAIVGGLAPLRNKMSDGHARVRKPAPHHARLVVNAAKTIVSFLVESYLFQKSAGLLPALPPSKTAAP